MFESRAWRLAAAVLFALLFVAAWRSSTAKAQVATTTFDGTLQVTWGDPHRTLGSGGETRYSIALDDGRLLTLQVSGLEGTAAFYLGKRVRITGRLGPNQDALANAASGTVVVDRIDPDQAFQADAPASAVTGTKKVIFLLVKFSDDTSVPHPPAFYSDMLNPDTPPAGEVFPTTINGFFKKTSGNVFSWVGDVGGMGGVGAAGGWLTLPGTKATYANCGWSGSCALLQQLGDDATALGRAQVIAAAQVPLGLPLIRVDTSSVAHRVGAIRQVESAQVSRDWPDKIVISVRLRTPVFAVAVPGGYALVDAFGVDLRNSVHRPAGFPLLQVGSAASGPWPGTAARHPGGAGRTGKTPGPGKTPKPGKTPGPGKTPKPGKTPGAAATSGTAGAGEAAGTPLRGSLAVRAAAAVLRELPPAVARRVRTVRAPTASEVSVRLAGGVVIVWGDPSRPAEKAKELGLLMRTHARSYDVSAPGTAVTQG